MEHEVAYNQLSAAARQAWETVSSMPLVSSDQQQHAWRVLCAEITALADDPHAGLYVTPPDHEPALFELFVSAAELAALRVVVAWTKAQDRAGLLRDLPVYPDVAEALIDQLGAAPWAGVWQAGYVDRVRHGGVLVLASRAQAEVLLALLDAVLDQAALCPGWSFEDRVRLFGLLCDVRCWIGSMLIAAE